MKNEEKRFIAIVILVIIFLAIVLNKNEKFSRHPVFKMYYADWCGYSQMALPEFEALGNEVISDSGQIIKIQKVDCEVDKSVCINANIEGYPTIRLEDGTLSKEYNGARETEKMLEFLKNQ